MVADASVVAALIFNEPEGDQARRLMEGAELHEPFLLAFELTNIACTKIRTAPEDTSTISADLGDGLALPFQWVDILHTSVLELSLETGLSAYDASYLHLAMSLGTSLASFDRRLRLAAQGRVLVLPQVL